MDINLEDLFSMKIIARIHTDFPTKFGVPRQSGINNALKATIVFEPEYRNPDSLRGLEEFSHIWLIWEFSEAIRDTSYCATSSTGWEHPCGRFCNTFPFPTQPHRSF